MENMEQHVEFKTAEDEAEHAYEQQDSDESQEPLDLQGERRLVTQPYDYSIQQIVDEIERKKIRLDIEYQRQYVWDDGKASRLIESLLLNVPIPVCYFAEDDDFNFEVIDGLQRITSLNRFLKDEYALTGVTVLTEVKGKKFSELASRDQRRLASRTIRCVALTSDSHPDIKFDVFERLNTNVAVLTPQEIRNCVYRGAFNNSLKEIATYEPLQNIVGTAGRKRMMAEELVLRFLALHSKLDAYRPPLRQFINQYMRGRRSAALSFEEKELFVDCIDTALEVFGSSAFSIPDKSGKVHNYVNKAVFDAIMITLASTDREELRARKEEFQSLIDEMIQDDEFRSTLGRATADRTRVYARIRAFGEAMEERGISVPVLDAVGRTKA